MSRRIGSRYKKKLNKYAGKRAKSLLRPTFKGRIRRPPNPAKVEALLKIIEDVEHMYPKGKRPKSAKRALLHPKM